MSSELSEKTAPYFPYDEPRAAQSSAIPKARETGEENGFTLLEGACGSGKTMLALSAGMSLVRDSSTKYERILAITSVKQQREAFENAVVDINRNLPDDIPNVSALSLTGKADVYPYCQMGKVKPHQVYAMSEELRENTRDIVENSASNVAEKRNEARSLYKAALDPDAEYPYGEYIPTQETPDGEVEYDPFYARHLTALYNREMDSASASDEQVIPFNEKKQGMVTASTLTDLAAKKSGTSPHGVMGELLGDVEITIGNYYHVFDSLTVEAFTEALIDEETFLIVDEAHNLVPRVRDLLGSEASFSGLERAAEELEEVAEWLGDGTQQTEAAEETARSAVEHSQTTRKEMVKSAKVCRAIHKKLGDRITSHIEDERGPRWRNDEPDEETSIAFRNPESVEKDMLSRWLEFHNDYGISHIEEMGRILDETAEIRALVYEEHFGYSRLTNSSLTAVGTVLSEWVSKDPASFFREIELEPAEQVPSEPVFDWETQYNAKLTVKNCIPREEIAECLDEFGGGVVMSATLVPFDVFKQVNGFDILAKEGRRIDEIRFGLPFPEENRQSLTVSAPSFKYGNRGDSTDKYGNPNLDNPTRNCYADVILDLVETTPGNVLIVMPSYSEAQWAGSILKRDGDVPARHVLIDESSSKWETDQMKKKFFGDERKVLVTGALGTLTEGVDYPGEKLNAVAVCGVPIQNTYSDYADAVQTAYSARFDNNGFEYAFSLPAVYKARQAIGRVIRTFDDVGVRLLVDERYAERDDWDNVSHFLSDEELSEFEDTEPELTRTRLESFWKFHDKS